MSAYVSIRQDTRAYVRIGQDRSGYEGIRQHTPAYVRIPAALDATSCDAVSRAKSCAGVSAAVCSAVCAAVCAAVSASSSRALLE
jgi:hypothetical protein